MRAAKRSDAFSIAPGLSETLKQKDSDERKKYRDLMQQESALVPG